MTKRRQYLGFWMLGLCAASACEAEGSPDWIKLIGETPSVQVEWAVRYEHGEGLARDYARAMQLYCAAARRGHVAAQYQLGWMYANGRGVARDDAQAAAWFRLAAARGDAPAQRMLDLVGDPAKTAHASCQEPVDPTRQPAPARWVRSGSSTPEQAKIETLVRRMAPDYGLQPALVLAVIEAESNFDSQALSPKNAQGLMQLIPETAERFGVRDPYDPVQNLRGGMAYLRWLLAYFQGDIRLALAGYNAGEGVVLRYGGVPPYAETQAYVDRITRAYGQLRHPPVAPVTRPAPLKRPSADSASAPTALLVAVRPQP
ncbi:MAG: transglycosylase SLT domain-containing protein [Candidatus Competibacter sp.]|nr:transglycosylase SLT domain-containing protein [Candidatus Competibacter sp.]MDG4585588.1 transglycosylase SLT domain-containing protein [Candidatus Competibacter sp.]